MSVSLLSGMAAKEIVISTMGVLYAGDGENQAITSATAAHRNTCRWNGRSSPPLVVIGFLLFVLIYFPCIATVCDHKRRIGLVEMGIV